MQVLVGLVLLLTAVVAVPGLEFEVDSNPLVLDGNFGDVEELTSKKIHIVKAISTTTPRPCLKCCEKCKHSTTTPRPTSSTTSTTTLKPTTSSTTPRPTTTVKPTTTTTLKPSTTSTTPKPTTTTTLMPTTRPPCVPGCDCEECTTTPKPTTTTTLGPTTTSTTLKPTTTTLGPTTTSTTLKPTTTTVKPTTTSTTTKPTTTTLKPTTRPPCVPGCDCEECSTTPKPTTTPTPCVPGCDCNSCMTTPKPTTTTLKPSTTLRPTHKPTRKPTRKPTWKPKSTTVEPHQTTKCVKFLLKEVCCPVENGANPVYIPHHEHVDHFFKCNWGVAHLMKCSPGTVFDSTLNVCVFKHNLKKFNL